MAALGQRRIDWQGCPHYDNLPVVRWGRASALPRYRCKACRCTFNALTNTPLAHLRMKDKWGTHATAMIDGTTIAKTAEQCVVAYKWPFRLPERVLEITAGDGLKPKALSGIVESDETFILASSRPKTNAAATAGEPLSPSLARLASRLLPASVKLNPCARDFHINTVNVYHGRLKEWMRHFHFVATRNLPNYLGWRRTLEALGNNASAGDWILGAIGGIGPYQQVR